ncbi:MAG: hypothetical protein R3F43_09515 [bacterium]
MANDPTAIPIGQGAVFLPAYTTGDREPPVTVLQDGGVVAEGRPGRGWCCRRATTTCASAPAPSPSRSASRWRSRRAARRCCPHRSGLVVGAATFNRTDQVGEQAGWDLGLSLFFDTTASFQRDAHQWITRLELEEEQSRPEDGEFTNEGDRLFLHTIYTYHLVPWFGPYLRVGLETKLLDRHQVFEQAQTVDELDRGGNVVKTHVDVDRVKLGGPFAPSSSSRARAATSGCCGGATWSWICAWASARARRWPTTCWSTRASPAPPTAWCRPRTRRSWARRAPWWASAACRAG